jgi:histone-lysine N-methyltransferase SETMAR
LFDKDKNISSRTAAEKLKRTYGEDALKQHACSNWLTKFRNSEIENYDLSDEPRSGRPNAISNDALEAAVNDDPYTTVRELAAEFNCSLGTIFNHLHGIGMVGLLLVFKAALVSDK